MTSVTDSHTVLWVPRYWPAVGGTEFHSHELARHLAGKQRVTVLTHCTTTQKTQQALTESAAQTRYSDNTLESVRTVELAPSKPFASVLTWLGKHHEKNRLARFLYQLTFAHAYKNSINPLLQDADRIHFIYNGLTEAAGLAARHAELLNIPFIFTPNILDTSATGSDWDSSSFHQLYNRAEKLIALTDHEAQWLIEHGVCEKKISVVPYGPILKPRDPSIENEDIEKLLSTRFILFLGRLVPSKGFMLLSNAFEKLMVKDPTTQLVVIGPTVDDSSEFFHQLRNQLGNKRVHLLQDISQPLKTAFLEEAAVLCVPSNSESLGGVYIEAMASKTPVVALNRPVSRCVIEHNKEGVLVNNDEESLIDGLRAVLDNPLLAKKMGTAGKLKVDDQFSWPVVTQKMLSAYDLSNNSLNPNLKKAS